MANDQAPKKLQALNPKLQAGELGDAPLSAADEFVVESRLAALRDVPASAVSLEEMKKRVRKSGG